MKTFEQILEEITNTQGTVQSVGVLAGWFSDLLKEIAGSGANATAAAAQHAATIDANKESLASAVAVNPS